MTQTNQESTPACPVEASPPGKGRGRARTIARPQLRVDNAAGADIEGSDLPRPTTRGDCRDEARPCPWVGCKHHLYLDINPETGSIKINFPDLEPWELGTSCALDVAERGGITLEEVGSILNVTRERVRQIEVLALLRIKRASPDPDELGADLVKGSDHT